MFADATNHWITLLAYTSLDLKSGLVPEELLKSVTRSRRTLSERKKIALQCSGVGSFRCRYSGTHAQERERVGAEERKRVVKVEVGCDFSSLCGPTAAGVDVGRMFVWEGRPEGEAAWFKLVPGAGQL